MEDSEQVSICVLKLSSVEKLINCCQDSGDAVFGSFDIYDNTSVCKEELRHYYHPEKKKKRVDDYDRG